MSTRRENGMGRARRGGRKAPELDNSQRGWKQYAMWEGMQEGAATDSADLEAHSMGPKEAEVAQAKWSLKKKAKKSKSK